MKKTVAERIRFIKKVREEQELSAAQIADLVSDNGEYVSERTIYKILADGSEEEGYQPHSVIAVFEALTAKFGDVSLPDDVGALKQLVAARNRHIDSLVLQLESQAEEYGKREALFEERKANFERTISLLEAQLEQLNLRFDKLLSAFLAEKE